MPRKNPISLEEKAICQRLREFRKAVGLTQAQFARRVGLSWRAYSNYELGRVKLNYAAARAVFVSFPKLDPCWLAEGDGIMLGGPYFITLPKPGESGEPTGAPFSLVYEWSLENKLRLSRTAFVNKGEEFPLFRVGDSIEGRIAGKLLFGEVVSGYLKQLTDGHVDLFLNEAQRAVDEVFDKHPKDPDNTIRQRSKAMNHLEALQPPFAPSGENELTDAETSSKVAEVKSQLPGLLERLKKATAQTGKKSELAEFLARATKANVPLASVSRWLSGEREPGGEIALQMDAWATAQGFPKGK